MLTRAERSKLAARSIGRVLYDQAEAQRNMMRKCVFCKTPTLAKTTHNQLCPTCIQRQYDKIAENAANRAREKKEAQERQAHRQQFMVGTIDYSATGQRQRIWYGLFPNYHEVYKAIERVYPNASEVPEWIEIEMRGDLKFDVRPKEELETDLREIKRKAEERKARETPEHPKHAKAMQERRIKEAARIALSRVLKRHQRSLQEVRGQGVLPTVPDAVQA